MKRLLALCLAAFMLIFAGCAKPGGAVVPPGSEAAVQTPVSSDMMQPVSSEAASRAEAAPVSESEAAPSSTAEVQTVAPSASDGGITGGRTLAQITEAALADEARFMSSNAATRDWSLAYSSFYDAYETLQPYTLTGLDDALALRGQLVYTLWSLSPVVIAGDIYDNIAEGASPVQVIDKFKQKNQNKFGVLLSYAETGDYYGESKVWLNSRPESNEEKFAEILSTNPFVVGDYRGRTSMTVTAGVEAQLLTLGFAYKTTEACALEIDGYAYGVCFIDRTYGQIAFWLGGTIAPNLSGNMHVGVVYPFELVAQDIHDRIDEIDPGINNPGVPEQPQVVVPVADPLTGKPVIYLYPEQPTDVTVTLHYPKEELTYTYPAYEDGWRVRAEPDGTLTNLKDGSTHYYLFWEGDKEVDWHLSEGFVVKGDETEAFLREKLAFLGLTPREYNDFITYWAPKMCQNPYNLISFSTEQYQALAPLTVTPAPDSMLRVHMVYKGLKAPVKVLPQTLSPWLRTGFAVVEWGGSHA